jgi:hypothetical protein
MQQVDRIAQGKAAVVLDHAFWASMLMNQRIVEDNSIPTLAVDSRGKIYYNKEFVEGLPIQQVDTSWVNTRFVAEAVMPSGGTTPVMRGLTTCFVNAVWVNQYRIQ